MLIFPVSRNHSSDSEQLKSRQSIETDMQQKRFNGSMISFHTLVDGSVPPFPLYLLGEFPLSLVFVGRPYSRHPCHHSPLQLTEVQDSLFPQHKVSKEHTAPFSKAFPGPL